MHSSPVRHRFAIALAGVALLSAAVLSFSSPAWSQDEVCGLTIGFTGFIKPPTRAFQPDDCEPQASGESASSPTATPTPFPFDVEYEVAPTSAPVRDCQIPGVTGLV